MRSQHTEIESISSGASTECNRQMGDNLFSSEQVGNEKSATSDIKPSLHTLLQKSLDCSSDCVQKLLDAHPDVIAEKDTYGRTPLFNSMKNQCPFAVTKLILEKDPNALFVNDFCGDSPLLLLYHHQTDIKQLEYVLREDPSLAFFKENSFSSQPLFRKICSPWMSTKLDFKRNDIVSNQILNERWKKLVLTLRAAFAHTTNIDFEPEKKCIPLHIALESKCCPKLLRHFVEMYPEQTKIPMSKYACFPLHYFLISYKKGAETSSLIRQFLKAFSGVTMEEYEGKLPVHLAVTSQYTWQTGLKELIFANSSVLDISNRDCGLIPFLQAAVLPDSDLSTVFSLLQESPSALTNLSCNLKF